MRFRQALITELKLGKWKELMMISGKALKDCPVGKSPVHKYSAQLSELLGFEGRSIGSLRGKEAVGFGTKLHSVCFYILAPRNRAHAILTVVFEKLFRRFD
jgi:hypothetical protein